MKQVWGDYIADILNSIAVIEDFKRGMTYSTFTQDRKTVNAVIRSLEVLGKLTQEI